MRKILSLVAVFSFSFPAFAQLQLGVFGGVSNYQGDLTDRPYQSTRGAAGFTAGYALTGRINLRAGLSFAKVAGADSLNKKDLRFRNLSFQSRITEFSLVGEFNTFNLQDKRWSPYVFGGLAIYHFNPYTFDSTGIQVFLQPLGTEGQGLAGYNLKPYARTQLAIPFGGGIKYSVSENFRVALEVGLRKLFTDYLDDVSGNYADPNDLLTAHGPAAVALSYRGDEVIGGSPLYPNKGDQRGSPKYKDFYYLTGLHLTYVFPEGSGRPGKGKPATRRGGYGCPTVF